MAKGAIDIEKKVNESLFGEDLSNILENNVHKAKKTTEKKTEEKQEDPFSAMFEEPPEEPAEIKVEETPAPKPQPKPQEPKPQPKPQPQEPKPQEPKPQEVKPKETKPQKRPPESNPQPRKEPSLVKKADHLPKGVQISDEKAEKLKKNPEVFILIHEVQKDSLVNNSNRSRSAGTQLLNDDLCSKLQRKDTKEEVILNKPIFKIGKSNKFADYIIRGNTAVSRRHVELITRNGICYVRDKNSTNGTFLDGIQLPPESEVEIRDGQTLTVANVEFIFRS